MKKVFAVLLALAMALTLAACGGKGGSGSSGKTDQPTFKIGLHFEQTGAVADYGNAELYGAQLAIEQANAAAGYEKYTTAVYDNKSDTTEAVVVANSLVADGVVGVVGPATSGASAATYQVSSDAGVVVISPSATQTGITLKDGTNPFEYVFRICFEDAYQGKAMAQFSVDELKASKAVIFGETTDYGKGLVAAFTEQFEKLGGSVVSTDFYNAGDTDFSGLLTKAQAAEFDMIYIGGYYNEAALIIKQAKDMGIDCVICGADGFDSQTLVEIAGKENLNNVFYTTAYTSIDASPALQAFIDAYKTKYNKEPAMFEALAYDATNLLIAGLEKAGQGGEALQKAIAEISFDGVTGSFTFDSTHSPIKTVIVTGLEDGVQASAVEVSPK